MNGVILQKENGVPVMQGNTTLADNKTIEYMNKKGISVYCICGKPFAESLMENGIINDTVICSICEKEMAYIVNREDLPTQQ